MNSTIRNQIRSTVCLAINRLSRPFTFALVGTSGVAVDLCTLALLLNIAPLPLSRALAIWVAMSWNFMLNRVITFSDARQQSIRRQYVMFCVACLAGGIANWSLSTFLVMKSHYFSQHEFFAAVCGIFAGLGWNYLLSSRFVFQRGNAKNDAEKLARDGAC